jgi:hypothetical protein
MNATFTTTVHAAQHSGWSTAQCVVGCLLFGCSPTPTTFESNAATPDTAVTSAPAISPVADSTLKENGPETIVLPDTSRHAYNPQTGDAARPETAYPQRYKITQDVTEEPTRLVQSGERRPIGLAEGLGHSSVETLPEKKLPAHEDTTVYEFVTEEAEFPRGWEALHAFLKTHINTPAQEFGMPSPAEQTVILSMVVEKDGRISQLTTINQSSTLPAYNEEALRVANMFPDFVPGKMNGEVVRSKFLIPVKFRFQ